MPDVNTNDSWHSNGSPTPEIENLQTPSQPVAVVSRAEPIKYTTPNIQRKLPKLPAFAKVRQARIPNAYDKTALKLQV